MINEKANRLQDSYNLIVDVHKYVDDLIIEAKNSSTRGFSTKQIANIVLIIKALLETFLFFSIIGFILILV